MEKSKHKLNIKCFPLFMQAKNYKLNYQKNIIENEEKKAKQNEEYKTYLEELNTLHKEKESLKKEKENIQNEIKSGTQEDIIEEAKLKKELKELKAKNNLEKTKIMIEKDIVLKKLENDAKILTLEKEHKFLEMEKKNNLDIKKLELKYKCLKDEIYDGTEFDELIKITKQKKDEIINNELENFIEQKKELEEFREKTNKKLEKMKIINENEIQKKFLEIQSYKLKEYNKLLMEKNKMFYEFKNKFSANKISNNTLKNKEIEKAKIFYEQQKNNLMYREQVFQIQKQNINAFMKQLEINDDEYSKYLLSLLK